MDRRKFLSAVGALFGAPALVSALPKTGPKPAKIDRGGRIDFGGFYGYCHSVKLNVSVPAPRKLCDVYRGIPYAYEISAPPPRPQVTLTLDKLAMTGKAANQLLKYADVLNAANFPPIRLTLPREPNSLTAPLVTIELRSPVLTAIGEHDVFTHFGDTPLKGDTFDVFQSVSLAATVPPDDWFYDTYTKEVRAVLVGDKVYPAEG